VKIQVGGLGLDVVTSTDPLLLFVESSAVALVMLALFASLRLAPFATLLLTWYIAVKDAVSPGATSAFAVQVVVPALPGDGDAQLKVAPASPGMNEKEVELAKEPGSRANLRTSVLVAVFSANPSKPDMEILLLVAVFSANASKPDRGILLEATNVFRANETNVVLGSVTSLN